MKDDKSYQVTLTKNQAQVLMVATEVLARLGIGQFRDALRHLPLSEYSPPGWHEALDTIGCILSQFTKDNVDGYRSSLGIHNSKTGEDSKIAWDLYQVLRHHLSWEDAVAEGKVESMNGRRNWDTMMTVNYDEPMVSSLEPLAKIETK